MHINRSAMALVLAAGCGLVVGCATQGPRPVEEMTRAHTLIDAADRGGNAQKYAPADLQRAHDELADAQRADGAGKYDDARAFAEAAAADANLAAARGAAGDAKHAAQEVVQSNATLRAESNRASDAAATPSPPVAPN